MKFDDFIKSGNVRRSSRDISLAKSLYKNTLDDLKYLSGQEINKLSARKIVVNYYDCLRAILEAISALDGYKIYQHEAFTYLLKEKKEDLNSIKFDRFRKIRNKTNYYESDILIGEARVIVIDIYRLIDCLIERYLKKELGDTNGQL